MPANPRDLVWAPAARRDLLDIWAYYTDVASSDVAERLLHDIGRAALRLLRHPMSGRPRGDIASSLRSMLVRPYAILYRATDTGVEIVRVLHTRRDFAAVFAEEV
jgi:toxin ParE1/3/4